VFAALSLWFEIMGGLIPDRVLEEIQSANDIVEVIGSYMPLKKAGKDYKAVCPFHNEKTPSFMVSQQKQIYHCFGCGAGGDVIGFVMKYERLDFLGAVRLLAERAGIEIPVYEKQNKDGLNKERLYRANEFAASCYHEALLRDRQAEPARAYIAKRGLQSRTVELFRIGYAPASWDFLLQRGLKAGFSRKELFDSGLIILKEGTAETYYDRFRQRIVFPVWNAQGKNAGFSGRVLDNALPKYVNTPETAVYNKSALLYGLHLAKDDIIEKGFAVICEGHVDLITLYQEGIRNACASQGTAFTTTHAKTLKRYAENIVLAFDGDSAGETATLRSCEIFIAEGLAVRIAVLPRGYDPDAYVREKGKEGFEQLVTDARDLLDFKLDLLKRKIDSTTLMGKTRIAAEMLETVAKFPSAVAASESIKRLAAGLAVSEDALWSEFRKCGSKNGPLHHAAQAAEPVQQQPMPLWERDFIALTMEDHRFIDAVGTMIALGDFHDPHARQIVAAMIALRDENRLNHAALLHRFDDPALKDLIASFSFTVPEGKDKTALFRDYLYNIKKRSLNREIAGLAARIAEAEAVKADYAAFLRQAEEKKTQLNNLGRELSLFCDTYK
jgi:DNA primase